MSTAIEWTDETWNPTVGCSHAGGPGCDNCYAARQALRHDRPGNAYEGTTGDDKAGWSGQVNLLTERLEQPLRWKRPRMVFVDSMSDLFHPRVPDEYIARVFAVMAGTPQHTYQILTKRPRRMARWVNGCAQAESVVTHNGRKPSKGGIVVSLTGGWPLPNVRLGTSVETQEWADRRIPHLLATPAAVRFISAEPLLGPLDLNTWLIPGWRCRSCGYERFTWEDDGPAEFVQRAAGGTTVLVCPVCHTEGDFVDASSLLDWVIVGGESGPGARPMHPDWARDLRDQCQGAGVPFFFKQWGAWAPFPQWVEETGESDDDTLAHIQRAQEARPGDRLHTFDDGQQMIRLGKTKAGRGLDGRTYDEMPEVAS